MQAWRMEARDGDGGGQTRETCDPQRAERERERERKETERERERERERRTQIHRYTDTYKKHETCSPSSMTKKLRLRVLYWSFFMLGSYCCLKAFTHITCPCTENTRLRHPCPCALVCVQLYAVKPRTRARVLSARAHLEVRVLRVTLHVCVCVCVCST